jgi:transmembrane sensor
LLLWNLRPIARMSPPPAAAALYFETRHGEQQTYRLTDNSVLHLNTDSAVTLRYSQTERLVVLTSGEAEFEVSHEPKRAFRVLAGSAEVVDLGTKFDVCLKQDSTVVTVVEGRAAVEPSPMLGKGGSGSSQDHRPRFVELAANQQISVTEGQWPATPIAVDARRTTSWLHRQIMFDHEPLERVAAEFNRYAPKPIEITTPQLRDLEVSGVFSTDDTEEFLAFLRSLEGVRVEVTATRIRVSQK